MSTQGHENEAINVQGLKASLQKFKTEHVDGGVHPDAVAGNVIGEFSDTGAEFAYRPTAGAVDIETGQADYGARLERVKGNTIPMNQINSKGDFHNTDFSKTYCTLSVENGILTTTFTGTEEQQSDVYTSLLNAITGHKYYYSIEVRSLSGTNKMQCMLFNTQRTVDGISTSWQKITLLTVCQSYKFIIVGCYGSSFQAKNWNIIDLTLIYGEGNEPTTPEAFEADYQKWFGKPLTYEEYDEGSLRPVKMTGIKTVGFNLWDEEWELGDISPDGQLIPSSTVIRAKNYISVIPSSIIYMKVTTYALYYIFFDAEKNPIGSKVQTSSATITVPSNARYMKFNFYSGYGTIYKHDTPINLSHSGDRNGEYEPYWESTLNIPITTLKGKLNGQGSSVVVFPDGMKKAGSVYDEIVKRGDKTYAIKRVGSVDMGSLNWAIDTQANRTKYIAEIGNIKSVAAISTEIVNMICTKYKVYPIATAITIPGDKTIFRGNASGFQGKNVGVYDSTYDSATEFKEACNGVMLYYELATPEEYLLDDFELPQVYDVDDYGTEEILLGTDGVAPILDLKYGINAGDTIKNLPHSYVSAVGEQNFTEAQKARARKNIGLSPEKLGFGIGTCTTSSGTALAVTLTDYELVQNGMVSVVFEHDVPANATLNINSKGAKPIIYRGNPIASGLIKGGDTITFAYNGSQYVVSSMGGYPDIAINLTQIGGDNDDLLGATVTITDDDSEETLFTGTWQGSTLRANIEIGVDYTISVSSITGYLACPDQSFTADGYQTKTVTFQYRGNGVFIEALDGMLYTSSDWASAGKTANSIVLITDNHRFRIWKDDFLSSDFVVADSQRETITNWVPVTDEINAKAYFNGEADTLTLVGAHSDATKYLQAYAYNYIFPDGTTRGYMPSSGELWLLTLNKNLFGACRQALNVMTWNSFWTSSTRSTAEGEMVSVWITTNVESIISYYAFWQTRLLVVGRYDD